MSKIYENYIKEFGDFLTEYDGGIVGPGKIGAVGCRFTQYLAECGKEQFEREVLYNIKHRDIVDSTDPVSGKPMAVNKGDIVADASPEYADYKRAKNDYESLAQMIGSLARLQKGAMSELSGAGV